MRLEERVNTFGTYLKNKYGSRTFRIGLSTGYPCPHRSKNGGCIFCLPDTYTDITGSKPSLSEQIAVMKEKVSNGSSSLKYLAYFHHETSTSGDIAVLKQLFNEALLHSGVVGLALSTRPDFINSEILKILEELNKEVFVEIGMQSVHHKSLAFLQRGHTFGETKQAIELCADYGFNLGVHLIVGIPGETMEDMLETVAYINSNKHINYVKLHNLVAYKGTALAEHKDISLLNLDEYIQIIGVIISHFRQDLVIDRFFTSNVNRTGLALNPFPGNKRVWTNRLLNYFNEHDILQGQDYNPPTVTNSGKIH